MFRGTILGDMFDTWLKIQVQLLKVERWSTYRIRNPKLRRQSVLQHQASVSFAIIPVLLKMKELITSLDTELIKDAFTVHDIPEGLLKLRYDILVNKKEHHHDLSEYTAFKFQFERMDPAIYKHFEKAFLLQFAHKSDEEINLFPDRAMKVMKHLKLMYPFEVALFPALESWEYLFYAYEGYKNKKDVFIFKDVIEHHLPALRQFAEKIVGFRQIVFTEDFEAELVQFLNNN